MLSLTWAAQNEHEFAKQSTRAGRCVFAVTAAGHAHAGVGVPGEGRRTEGTLWESLPSPPFPSLPEASREQRSLRWLGTRGPRTLYLVGVITPSFYSRRNRHTCETWPVAVRQSFWKTFCEIF